MPSRSTLDSFREVWAAGVESSAMPGERADPACLVARESGSGRTARLGRDDLRGRADPPYPTDSGSLLVAYGASDVLGCHLALGWPVPARVLDLRAEFRNRTNGLALPHGAGLYGALAWHGLNPLPGIDGPRMRALAAREEPRSASERAGLLEAVEARVFALSGLLAAMLPRIDLGLALYRGRYGAAVARMERSGSRSTARLSDASATAGVASGAA